MHILNFISQINIQVHIFNFINQINILLFNASVICLKEKWKKKKKKEKEKAWTYGLAVNPRLNVFSNIRQEYLAINKE